MKPAPDQAGISRRAFAKLDGCSERLVRRALERGFLTALPNGRLNPEQAGTGWRERNRRAAEAEQTPEDGLPTLAESKRQISHVMMQLEQIELDLRQGRTVLLAPAVAEFGKRLATLRTKLLALPAEQAVSFSRLKTTDLIEARLSSLLSAALIEFSRYIAPH